MTDAPTTMVPTVRDRLAVAILAALLAGALLYLASTPARVYDVDLIRFAQHEWLSGRDPYETIGPDASVHWNWRLYYPFTAVISFLPLAWLPADWFRYTFAGLGVGLLTFGITRDGWQRLPVVLSGAVVYTVLLPQFSTYLVAAWFLPGAAWLVAIKPNLGLAALMSSRSRRHAVYALGGASMLGLLSLALFPAWPLGWLDAVREGEHLRPIIMRPWAWIALSVLLRWREPEARLVAAFICVPMTTFVYETVMLACVIRSESEAWLFVWLTWLAWMVQLSPPQTTFALHTEFGADVILWIVVMPLVALVLLRRDQPGGTIATGSGHR